MKNAIFASQKFVTKLKICREPQLEHLWHISNDTQPAPRCDPTRRAATLFVLLQRVFPKFKSADIFYSERGFC